MYLKALVSYMGKTGVGFSYFRWAPAASVIFTMSQTRGALKKKYNSAPDTGIEWNHSSDYINTSYKA